MRKVLPFVFLFVVAFGAQAAGRLRAPDFTVAAEQRGAGRLEVVATPPPGIHFNMQAPAYALKGDQKIKPSSLKEGTASFELPSAAAQKLRISLYLCDDRKSFCENHQVDFEWRPNFK